MSDFQVAGNVYPVGTVVASAKNVYIKKENSQPPKSPFYENWWKGTEPYALPIYSDDYITNLVNSGEFKILRMGKE